MRSLIVVLVLFGCHGTWAQSINDREVAIDLIRELRKIHTPNGIELTEQVTLNGDKQWINIRGKDKANPVLLFIHGGSASPVMPLSWAFQSPWEDFFTVVQWDQRVAGKNWSTADTTFAKAKLNGDLIVQDGVALIDYLCKKLNKEKIFIMGYSFGARVGIQLAALVPEKLHAFIGVGQPSPGDSEGYIYKRLMAVATEAKNETALQELNAIAPYPKPEGKTPVLDILLVRKWARYFNGGWYGKADLNLYFSLPELSPDYTREEIESLEASTKWAGRRMVGTGNRKEFDYTFKIPIVMMMGIHDLHTPYEPARAYFEKIMAPNKKFYSFGYSGHFPFLEEPGIFFIRLVNEVLPLKDQKN